MGRNRSDARPAVAPTNDPVPTGRPPVDDVLSDDELTALAMADLPGQPPAADAVPLASFLGDDPGLLPTWYMPTPMTRIRPRWRTPVVLAIVAAFVAIEAFGLCSTFGQIVPA